MVNKIFLSILLFSAFLSSKGATVDTVTVKSGRMAKGFKCVVIKPASYKNTKKTFPVVYLLHGFSGSYNNWIKYVPGLTSYADQYQLMIVCPDGGYAGWYFDSPIDLHSQYETYIGTEVPHYIDSAYRTIRNAGQRAITGLSMGGHGAIFIAWRHPHQFGAAGSMSGVVDLKESAHKYAIEKVIGDTTNNLLAWKQYSVLYMVEHKDHILPAMIFDCGINDGFIGVNRRLHLKMMTLNIPHDYIERPGVHGWEYWKNAVSYQLLYFHKYFMAHQVNSRSVLP